MSPSIRSLRVQLTRERSHWRCELYVDSEVEPRTIFGCSQGLEPIIRALSAAEAKITAVGPLSEFNPIYAEPRITVTMPSGRDLAFSFSRGEQLVADVPESGSTIGGRGGDG